MIAACCPAVFCPAMSTKICRYTWPIYSKQLYSVSQHGVQFCNILALMLQLIWS